MKKQILILMAAVLMTAMTATTAFGQATGVGTNTVSPTLQISAKVFDAVELSLSTGTLLTSHCAITGGAAPTGAYQMSFGNVDALGISAGCGNVVAPTTPGNSAATYYTDFTLTPAWVGLTATTAASITAYTSTSAEAGVTVAIPTTADASTVASLSGGWTTLATTAAAANTVVSGSATSGLSKAGVDGTNFTRFLGLQVQPTATASATGTSTSATVTFTMTIQ